MISRLLHNVHTWTINDAGLRRVNGTYMRVYWKIRGQSLFSDKDNISDVNVRIIGNIPSIDCIMRRARLRFLARIVQSSHSALKATLALSFRGVRLPWVRAVIEDLHSLHCASLAVQASLPSPGIMEHDSVWFDFMLNQREMWITLVNGYFFAESCLDKTAIGADARLCVSGLTFRCTQCTSQFSNNKALLQHRRSKHGFREPLTRHIDGSGVCPSCRTTFHTRLRLLAHVSDRRNQTCSLWILGNVPSLSNDEIGTLEVNDREARNTARKNGHTHAIASRHAVTASGHKVGHVQL